MRKTRESIINDKISEVFNPESETIKREDVKILACCMTSNDNLILNET